MGMVANQRNLSWQWSHKVNNNIQKHKTKNKHKHKGGYSSRQQDDRLQIKKRAKKSQLKTHMAD